MSFRKYDMPLTMEEIREFMRREKSKKGLLLGIVIGVMLALVAVVLWVARNKSKDLEEHYEYFDDEFEDEFEDEEFAELDDDLYGDEDASGEGIEYVKIKDFMSYDDEEQESSDTKEDKEQ